MTSRFCPILRLVLLYAEGIMRWMWEKSPCHKKGTIMFRGELSLSDIIRSSVWCSGENLVGTNTGFEGLGEERGELGLVRVETGDGVYVKYCCRRAGNKLFSPSMRDMRSCRFTFQLQSLRKNFLITKIAHSRKGNRSFTGTGIIY